MIKYLTTLLLMICCNAAFPQAGSHEVRLNLLNSLLGSVDLQYEKLLNNDSGVGLTLGVGYNTGSDDVLYNSIVSVSPFYRMYFSQKKSAGFFVEGGGRWSYDKSPKRKENNAGISLSMGGKVLSKKELVASFKGGVGRFLTENHAMDTRFYPVLEIAVGKRF